MVSNGTCRWATNPSRWDEASRKPNYARVQGKLCASPDPKPHAAQLVGYGPNRASSRCGPLRPPYWPCPGSKPSPSPSPNPRRLQPWLKPKATPTRPSFGLILKDMFELAAVVIKPHTPLRRRESSTSPRRRGESSASWPSLSSLSYLGRRIRLMCSSSAGEIVSSGIPMLTPVLGRALTV